MIIPAPTIPGIWRRIIHRTAGASRKLRTKAITTGRKKSRAKYKLYNMKSKKMPVSAMDRMSTGPGKTSWRNVLMSGRESSVRESCGRAMVRSRADRIVMSFLGVCSGSFKKLSACQVGEKLSAARNATNNARASNAHFEKKLDTIWAKPMTLIADIFHFSTSPPQSLPINARTMIITRMSPTPPLG